MARAQKAKDERKHREGKRTFTTHIFEQDYKTLKRAAVDYDTNVQALVDEALALLFKKKGYEKHRERALEKTTRILLDQAPVPSE